MKTFSIWIFPHCQLSHKVKRINVHSDDHSLIKKVLNSYMWKKIFKRWGYREHRYDVPSHGDYIWLWLKRQKLNKSRNVWILERKIIQWSRELEEIFFLWKEELKSEDKFLMRLSWRGHKRIDCHIIVYCLYFLKLFSFVLKIWRICFLNIDGL